jgi:tRNA threonylcarbamoyladenosine biosynthesis protein TsaE
MSPIALAHAAATVDLGARLAHGPQIGDALCLFGDLGAGKSTLARGLIRALTTPDEEVPSPTFTLVQTYDAPSITIAHFDLYRLTHAAEAYEIGVEEALENGCAIIEWPERLEGDLPRDRLDIELSVDGEARIARITPHGRFEASFEGRELGI